MSGFWRITAHARRGAEKRSLQRAVIAGRCYIITKARFRETWRPTCHLKSRAAMALTANV